MTNLKLVLINAAAATLVAGAALAHDAAEVSASNSELLGKFETTGEVENCLMMRRVTSIKPVTETTFLVEAGGVYYVNNVSGKCSGATRQSSRLEFSTTSAQLCRMDIATVVDNNIGMTTGSCSLGAFEKLTMKAPA